ncbi:hypothetical protein BD626DRAFT_509861 [Schizophyllum amplum]|uniref:Uncharacterized protein n=1 Tax=Schizophyllum amplum TaxID=97359 RepID=A0A550C234_9AGAR|nr:hypothetical protein BD626DRAFT_509861 [Auriculariopsis ampla]
MWSRRCIRSNVLRVACLHESACARYHPSFSVKYRAVSSSAVTPIVSKPSRVAKAPMILTLSPAKLTDAEVLEVSGKTSFNIRTPFGTAQLPYWGNRCFPLGTHGFLYVPSPPADPSIRFRIVDGGNPADFDHCGRDLLLPNGVTPWNISQNTLEKSQSTVPLRRLLAHEGLGSRDGATAQWLQSLNPARLTSLDAVTLSGQMPDLDLPQGRVRLAYTGDQRTKFPENTRGFLYFDTASLSVRFRVVDDAMEFAQGSDLLLPDERTPWCISFHRLACWATYTSICKQLLLDNLITERQIQARTYVVSTLDHTRLSDADWIDLSGLTGGTILVAPTGQESFTLVVKYRSPSRFPSYARGFLYWHVPKDDPYGAELRFRCAESLEHFARGGDLWTSGLRKPWSLNLRGLARRSPYNRPLLAYLTQVGLVDESAVDHLAKTTVTHMRDLFFLRLSVRDSFVRLRTGSLSGSIRFRNMPWFGVYNGAALARLVVLEDTSTSIRLDIRIVTLLDGPRKVSDGKAWSDADSPKEGQLVFGVHVPKVDSKNFWTTIRGAKVRKSSNEGQVLMKVMEQSEDNVDNSASIM